MSGADVELTTADMRGRPLTTGSRFTEWGMTEYLNRVHHGDCLAVMADLPPACVDLVVTSPPYNLREGSGNGWKSPKNRKWHSAKLPGGYEGKLWAASRTR